MVGHRVVKHAVHVDKGGAYVFGEISVHVYSTSDM